MKKVRLQKAPSGSGQRKRKHMYFDQLVFLLDTMDDRMTSTNIHDGIDNTYEDEESKCSTQTLTPNQNTTTSRRNKRKVNSFEEQVLEHLKASNSCNKALHSGSQYPIGSQLAPFNHSSYRNRNSPSPTTFNHPQPSHQPVSQALHHQHNQEQSPTSEHERESSPLNSMGGPVFSYVWMIHSVVTCGERVRGIDRPIEWPCWLLALGRNEARPVSTCFYGHLEARAITVKV
uniref:(California timema) hypothetical protein n=1 Tax=Timema californicum TaxID=61474 RepID=A0A7R9J1J4_TIMCA|nr:unnamed protein product [Timema californicum]